MFDDQAFQTTQFRPPKTAAPLKPHRLKPKLGFAVPAVHMNMQWFMPIGRISGMRRIEKQSTTILVYMAHNDCGHGLLQQPLPPPPNAHHVKPLARKEHLRHRLGPISGFPLQPIPYLHPANLAFRITNDKHDGESLLHPVPDMAGLDGSRISDFGDAPISGTAASRSPTLKISLSPSTSITCRQLNLALRAAFRPSWCNLRSRRQKRRINVTTKCETVVTPSTARYDQHTNRKYTQGSQETRHFPNKSAHSTLPQTPKGSQHLPRPTPPSRPR